MEKLGRCWLASGVPRGGAAIAVIEVEGDVDAMLSRVGVRGVNVGRWGLRDFGVDEVVVARWEERRGAVMPHGGAAVVRAVLDRLRGVGLEIMEPMSDAPSVDVGTFVKARMIDALARAASPLAVDVLLRQPALWRRGTRALNDPPNERDHVLRRLIDPPTVVACGRPNIGKSSLLNALASGERVALVADEPGTTRDHVGVLVNLGGLVVRWVDTPGLSGRVIDALDAESQRAARSVIAHADLVVSCCDATAGWVEVETTGDIVSVGLRADRGVRGDGMWVSSATGAGIETLVRTIRERLVPMGLLHAREAWRFW